MTSRVIPKTMHAATAVYSWVVYQPNRLDVERYAGVTLRLGVEEALKEI